MRFDSGLNDRLRHVSAHLFILSLQQSAASLSRKTLRTTATSLLHPKGVRGCDKFRGGTDCEPPTRWPLVYFSGSFVCSPRLHGHHTQQRKLNNTATIEGGLSVDTSFREKRGGNFHFRWTLVTKVWLLLLRSNMHVPAKITLFLSPALAFSVNGRLLYTLP